MYTTVSFLIYVFICLSVQTSFSFLVSVLVSSFIKFTIEKILDTDAI